MFNQNPIKVKPSPYWKIENPVDKVNSSSHTNRLVWKTKLVELWAETSETLYWISDLYLHYGPREASEWSKYIILKAQIA